MERKFNFKLLANAKNLRRNMTKEERRLWYNFLSNYSEKFVRQKIIGNYIADFYCAKAKLVTELDGSQHYEDANMEYDEVRSKYFAEYGIDVLRISNLEVNKNFRGVCEYINRFVVERLAALKVSSHEKE